MTFKELRHLLIWGPQTIRWNKSGIVELAQLQRNGAIVITNVISRKSYHIPKRYNELNITIVPPHEMVALGDLLPKNMR
jgi:hypothetical protein